MTSLIITNKDRELLENSLIDNYPLFSLNGLVTYAKLLANYDGDTGDIFFIYNQMPMRMKARFTGYDTCEIKPQLKDPKRDEKKKRAQEAKKRLWFLCTNTEELKSNHKTLIKIKCGEFDKYGRLLIIAYNENVNFEGLDDEKAQFDLSINAQMINEGHGYVYNGGTKNNEF